MNNKKVNYVNAENNEVVDYEKELESATDSVLEDIDFSELEEVLEAVDVDFSLFGGETFKGYVSKIIKGEETVSLGGMLKIFVGGAVSLLKEMLFPLLVILAIVLLFGVFNNFKPSSVSGVGDIIRYICLAVVSIILAKISSSVISEAKQSLVDLQKQMNAIFPVLLSLMSIMGGAISVKAYSPMFAFLTNSVSTVFIYVLFPLFIIGFVLSIVGCFSKNNSFEKINGFISSLFKWVIGIIFTVYMAFMTLNGLTAGASDGISIKATKYAIKNYVPMLGGYISDGFQVVKAGGLLVKNATGFTGILMLFASIISPILSVAVIELGLKFVAGVIDVVGDKKSSSLLYGVAKSFKLLTVVLVGVSLMYFFTIFLTMCSVSSFV